MWVVTIPIKITEIIGIQCTSFPSRLNMPVRVAQLSWSRFLLSQMPAIEQCSQPLVTFHSNGWFIEILIMVYYDPYINDRCFGHCSIRNILRKSTKSLKKNTRQMLLTFTLFLWLICICFFLPGTGGIFGMIGDWYLMSCTTSVIVCLNIVYIYTHVNIIYNMCLL